MTFELRLLPRSLRHIEAALDQYESVEHGEQFLVEL